MPRVHDSALNPDDPIPAPGPWELEKYGSVFAWETHIRQRRRQRREKALRNQKKKEAVIGHLGVLGEHSNEEWDAMASSMDSAIMIRSMELNQMKMLDAMIKDQLEVAQLRGASSFILNLARPPRQGIKGFRTILKARINNVTRDRAEEGFKFFDRLMRQTPSPGTVRQTVSERPSRDGKGN